MRRIKSLLLKVTMSIAMAFFVFATGGVLLTVYSQDANVALASEDTFPVWYPENYGQYKRVIIQSSNSVFSSIYVDGVQYTPKKHSISSSVSGSYDEDSTVCYIDVPYSASQITDFTITFQGKTRTISDFYSWGGGSLPTTSFQYLRTEFSPYNPVPSDCLSGLSRKSDGTGDIKGGISTYSNISWCWSDLTNKEAFLATALEGCYSCSSDAVNGYGALGVIKDNWIAGLTASQKTTLNALTIDDISGYSEGGTTRCTVEKKLIQMEKMRTPNPGGLVVEKSLLGQNNYIWVVIVASVVAFSSFFTVVISASRKKKREQENNP